VLLFPTFFPDDKRDPCCALYPGLLSTPHIRTFFGDVCIHKWRCACACGTPIGCFRGCVVTPSLPIYSRETLIQADETLSSFERKPCTMIRDTLGMHSPKFAWSCRANNHVIVLYAYLDRPRPFLGLSFFPVELLDVCCPGCFVPVAL